MKHTPRVYRAMLADGGLPKVGDRRGMLGVRVPGGPSPYPDVEVESGIVVLGASGLSVGPSMRSLDLAAVPDRLNHLVPGARGRADMYVWRLGDGVFAPGPIDDRLELVIDPCNASHGFIRPRYNMSVAEFQGSLAATREAWVIDET